MRFKGTILTRKDSNLNDFIIMHEFRGKPRPRIPIGFNTLDNDNATSNPKNAKGNATVFFVTPPKLCFVYGTPPAFRLFIIVSIIALLGGGTAFPS